MSSRPNIAATSATPGAETLVGATTDGTSSQTSDTAASQQAAMSSEPNAQGIASGSNTAPRIIAPIDDAASAIPKDSTSQQSTSSDSRSNDPEPAPHVSVAQPHAPLAAATVDAHPIPPDLVSDGREKIALSDNAGMRVRPFHLILAFVVALVGTLYYVVLRYLPGGSGRIRTDHPEDNYVDDDQYNNPEFYRKLRRGAVLEKS
jgi:hypothetical protein